MGLLGLFWSRRIHSVSRKKQAYLSGVDLSRKILSGTDRCLLVDRHSGSSVVRSHAHRAAALRVEAFGPTGVLVIAGAGEIRPIQEGIR